MSMEAFEKVIGYENIKKELIRVVDMMQHPEKYEKLGAHYPQGILLHGEPGLGKTLLANCFIEASGWKAFTCRKNRSDGDFVNAIRETFDQAKENAPAIVFLDDMDKFANEDCYHRNTEEFVTIQSCIDDNKQANIIVLATANDLDNLPDSLLRAGRFDLTLRMFCPNGEDARRIILHYLKQKQYVDDINVNEIADLLDGNSCAELETVINEAGIIAGFAGKDKIEKNDIIKACLRIIFKAEEDTPTADKNYRMRIAVHEAGHAAAKELLEPGSVSLVTIRKHGDFGGVTVFHRNDALPYDKVLQEQAVMVALAGRAASEILYGITDVGANSDIHRAFEFVERFVDNFCTQGFGNFEFLSDHSHAMLQRKEDLVFSELERYYQQVKKLLIENRGFLEKLAAELCERDTLLSADVMSIKAAA